MSDQPDPPRKIYSFKEAAFERVNEVSASAAPAGAIDVRELAQAAHPRGQGSAAKSAGSAENGVRAMLRANEVRAAAAGATVLKPQPKRRSRRKRDYWLVLVPVDAFFAVLALTARNDAMALACGTGGLALFTAGFTWVMWVVIDDY